MNTQPQASSGGQILILLRWLLIVATSYLVLFSRPLHQTPVSVALFVAGYLASNLLLPALQARVQPARSLTKALVLFDTAAVSIGLALTGNGGTDFFPVFFLVVFLGALTHRVDLVVGAATLLSIVHLSTVAQFVDLRHLLASGYLLRVPFLFTVALFFGYQVDRTQRQQRVARARSRKRMRTELISSVTHDIKNPVGIIQSLAEFLLDGSVGALSAEQTEVARRIHASARHVIHLSVNLLDAARIESGHLALQRTSTNLANVVADAIELARSAGDLKGVTLELDCPSPPPTIAVDVLQMERVISNLLDNAIKYTPRGGAVTVAIHSEPGEVAISVRDNGPGLPPEELPRIFERYRRRAAASGVPGSGLGLFIVDAIVKAHGGRVEIESRLGHGTTISVHVPTVVAPPEPAPHPAMVLARSPRWRVTWDR